MNFSGGAGVCKMLLEIPEGGGLFFFFKNEKFRRGVEGVLTLSFPRSES